MSRLAVVSAIAFITIAALPASGLAQQRIVVPPTVEQQMQRLGVTGWRQDPNNRSQIILLPRTFQNNLVRIHVPQLVDKPMFSLEGTKCRGAVFCHRQAQEPLLRFFAELQRAGLLDKILTYDGMYFSRLVRGADRPSNHAFGMAFDLNGPWNGLGQEPAALGARGSVRELVDIAQSHGWAWGGFYEERKDGMHFELPAR